MERDGRLALVVGSFVVAALVALAAAILSLTSEQGIFVPRYRLVSRFENVQGLLPGAPVWLAGKEVGRVDDIRFEPVGSERPVRVSMQIVSSVQDRVRGDSLASIGTIGVLGDSYVEVSVGTPGAAMLEDGAEIRSQSPININSAVAKGSRALDNVARLAENLNDVVEQFDKEGGAQVASGAIKTAGQLMTQIQEGPGLLHRLIYDDYEGEGVASVERSLARLENILGEVAEGEGLLHSLIYDAPRDRDVLMQTIEAGARLNELLAKIERGEGTLGLLVSDPTVYEELQRLLGGARRSLVVRSMIRMVGDEE